MNSILIEIQISGFEVSTKIPSLRHSLVTKKYKTSSCVQIKEKKKFHQEYTRIQIYSIALIMEQMDFLVGYDSTFERWTKRNDRREKESVTKIDKHTHTDENISENI